MKPVVSPKKDRFLLGIQVRLKKFFNKIEQLDNAVPRRQIHQLRVLSRRLRAAFGILKAEPEFSSLRPVAKRVKKLTTLLSPIRSLDVSEGLFRARLKSLPVGGRKRLACCLGALKSLRRESRQRLREQGRRLGPPAHWKKNLQGWKPKRLAAWKQTLRRRLEKTRRQAGRSLAAYRSGPTMLGLHRFRIRLKKYRYVLELHAEQTGRPDARLNKLKTLQDHIGELHDLEVLKDLLQSPRVAAAVRRADAEKDWRDFLHRLESEIAAGERNFLARHRRRLQTLFGNEAP